jgi:hypothetical protein
MMVGLYYAAIRQNLTGPPPGNGGPDDTPATMVADSIGIGACRK